MEFEKALFRLEEIVQNLENSQLSLEESMLLYEEGMKLGKGCQDKLSKIERKVFILKNGEDPEEENTKTETKKKKKKVEDNFSLFEQ